MKRIFLLASLLLGVFTGCQGVNSVSRETPIARPQVVPDKRLITSSYLDSHLQIFEVTQAPASTNHLQIQARVENLTYSPFSFRYLVEWYDAQGMVLPSPTVTWQPVTLQARETSPVRAIAVNPKAVDFVIKFQQQ